MMKARKRTGCALVLAAALLATSTIGEAAPVTSRAALGANDFFNWGQLGSDGTQVGPLPASVTSNLGRSASVNNGTGGDLWRFDEGAGTYGGNFSAGDQLLFTLFTNGPISVSLSGLTSGIGAQIQAGSGTAFTGYIRVYDASNNLLETESASGSATDFSDLSNGAAIFLGITRAMADIARVEFSVAFTTPGASDFSVAINQLSFLSGPTALAPEPDTSMLAVAGLIGAIGARVRRRRAAAAPR